MLPAAVDEGLLRLYPRRCVLCRAPTDGPGFCTPCLLDLPWLDRTCAACGRVAEHTVCTACARQSALAPAASVRVALRYAYPVDALLAALKYAGQRACARPLGEALAIALAEARADGAPWPDYLVPVPLHPRRAAQRGFNQAELLAESVARVLGLTLSCALLERVRDTPAQATLSRAARLSNLRNAFVARTAIDGSVALLDDVLTTGATVRSAAAALLAAGARCVTVWCVARPVVR